MCDYWLWTFIPAKAIIFLFKKLLPRHLLCNFTFVSQVTSQAWQITNDHLTMSIHLDTTYLQVISHPPSQAWPYDLVVVVEIINLLLLLLLTMSVNYSLYCDVILGYGEPWLQIKARVGIKSTVQMNKSCCFKCAQNAI